MVWLVLWECCESVDYLGDLMNWTGLSVVVDGVIGDVDR